MSGRPTPATAAEPRRAVVGEPGQLRRVVGAYKAPPPQLVHLVSEKRKSGGEARRSWEARGWHSAGEIGRWDQVEVQPYERTTEDPDQLERAQPQRDRRERERGSPVTTECAGDRTPVPRLDSDFFPSLTKIATQPAPREKPPQKSAGKSGEWHWGAGAGKPTPKGARKCPNGR
jgi:hypothetical protein